MLNLDSFSGRHMQDSKALFALAKQAGITTIAQLETEIDSHLARLREERKRVATEQPDNTGKYHSPGGPPLCPDCGRGYIVRRKREGIIYETCRYIKPQSDPKAPQGCGWSRLVNNGL